MVETLAITTLGSILLGFLLLGGAALLDRFVGGNWAAFPAVGGFVMLGIAALTAVCFVVGGLYEAWEEWFWPATWPRTVLVWVVSVLVLAWVFGILR